MAVRLKTFRNKSKRAKSLLIGEGYLLEPGDEITLGAAEAAEAIELYGDFLEEVNIGEIGKTVTHEKPNLVYLANLSGDPDAPDEVTVRMHKNPVSLEMVPVKRKNNKARPTPYVFRYRSSAIPPVHTQDGVRWQEGTPTLKLIIKPGERVPVDRKLAEALLRDSALKRPEGKEWVIEARPPANFEPERSWTLDGLRTWLFQVTRDAELCGPCESDIRRDCDSKAEADLAIERQRILMWRRCWLRMVNPAVDIPTRSQWEKFTGMASVQKSLGLLSDTAEKVVDTQLKKKAGKTAAA